MTLTLGIDPGLSGAYAFLDASGALVSVEDLPIIRDGRAAWIDAPAFLSRLLALRDGRPARAVVERVHAMPRNGTIAAFSQGCTLGSVLATLQVANASVTLVTPGTWKRALGLSSDKRASLDKARLLFPDAPLDRKKDHGRAEALLIAWHAYRWEPGHAP